MGRAALSDFRTVDGFEEAWRPPVRPRRRSPRAILGSPSPGPGDAIQARLARIASRAPEVLVKVTGRTRSAGHLRAHLDYISRNGELEMEDREGAVVAGRAGVKTLAEDWSVIALSDKRRRATTPFSLSVVLSMPSGADPAIVRDAARAFAREVFADRHDYVFALHTDAAHPHVHLAVRALGDGGERLNPKKADLEAWRQVFAQALRERGLEAEATPRRARGITRKPETTPLRRMRERHELGEGAASRISRDSYREAARAAFLGDTQVHPWERQLLERQAKVRGLYLAQAQLLRGSAEPSDQALAAKVEAFVRAMPEPASQRMVLARELRAARRGLEPQRSGDGKERGR